jgi:putative lipase involved disintegration of autophagic bodies
MKKLTIKCKDGSKVVYDMRNDTDWYPYLRRHEGSRIESAVLQQYPKNKNEAVVLYEGGVKVVR